MIIQSLYKLIAAWRRVKSVLYVWETSANIDTSHV